MFPLEKNNLCEIQSENMCCLLQVQCFIIFLEENYKKEVDKINQQIKENKKTLDDTIASQTKGFKDINEKLGKS